MNIQPAPWRVKVQPVNGVPIPDPLAEATGEAKKPRRNTLKCGIVLEIGPGMFENDDDETRWGFLQAGTTIWYKEGEPIGEHVFVGVDADNIIAYGE